MRIAPVAGDPGPVIPEAAKPFVAEPDTALLALDYDGTLAPIVADPACAYPAPGALAALQDCAATFGTVVVLTARPAGTAVALGGLSGLDVVVLGHYGMERWTRQTGVVAPPVHPGVIRARLALRDDPPPRGVRVEDKGLSIAVHTREAEHPVVALVDIEPRLTALAHETGLELTRGRFVLELRPPGRDKGVALRELATERGARAVMMAGDDIGDGSAYDAVDALRTEGVAGMLVFVDSTEGPGELRERADVVVSGPDGTVALLRAMCEAASR